MRFDFRIRLTGRFTFSRYCSTEKFVEVQTPPYPKLKEICVTGDNKN